MTATTSQRIVSTGIALTTNAAIRTAGIAPTDNPTTSPTSTSGRRTTLAAAAAAPNAPVLAMIGKASRGSIPSKLSIANVGA
jgi:hypothetical protein